MDDLAVKYGRALGAAEAALQGIKLMATHCPDSATLVLRLVERAEADIARILEREIAP